MTTPKMGHDPIQMRRLPDLTDETGANGSRLLQVGDFIWDLRDGKRRLLVSLPSKHVAREWLWSEWTIDHENASGSQWTWDGDSDAPTLSPSLHWVGVWHGWVQNGRLIEA